MTEQDWMTSNDPQAMLGYITGSDWADTSHEWNRIASDRKLRLFAQHVSYPIIDEATGEGYPNLPLDYLSGWYSAAGMGGDPASNGLARQAALLREIFGNPFRPAKMSDFANALGFSEWLVWNNGTIPRIAQAIYEDRAFDQMPILADALEEAGCSDEDILNHCRGEGPHVRGCWVLDLILGKE
jgi:hypothetical protein